MHSADLCTVVRKDRSPLNPAHRTLGRSPGVFLEKAQSFHRVDARFIKPTPAHMEDFTVTCQLAPDVPHLQSGSCSSPRGFELGFLQTSRRVTPLPFS